AGGSSNTESALGKYDQRVVEQMVDEQLKSANQDPEDADDNATERARKATLAKLQSMSPAEYQAKVKKAKDDGEVQELVSLESEEAASHIDHTVGHRQQFEAMLDAEKKAKDKVLAMTPAERQAELARLRTAEQAEAQAAAARAAAARASNPTSSASASLGMAVIVLLIFGIRPIIIMILAMGIAYRTASGSVTST